VGELFVSETPITPTISSVVFSLQSSLSDFARAYCQCSVLGNDATRQNNAGSWYVPNTSRSASEISPTVAYAFTASRMNGIVFA
jgi:hypothetical protein